MEDKLSIQVTITIDGVTTHNKVNVDSFIIGRHQDTEIKVLHPQVSRQHLKVTVNNNRIFFEDIGSSNGTFLNENRERIEIRKPFLLNPSDVIRLGNGGPLVKIQLEEKKISRVKDNPTFPSSIPKMPETRAVIKTPAPESIPQSSPSQFVPPSLQKESEKTLMEASKQAAQIIQRAELQAEAKAQEAHRHAVETEQKAEKRFQERLKAANQEAQAIFEEARAESQKLIQETRVQTQSMRDQAEADTRELRKSSEEKCVEVLREAEAQGYEIKAKRLSEADQIIEKKGEELLQATYEKIEKEKSAALIQLDSLKAKTSKAREAMEDAEEEKLEMDKKLAEIKREIKIQQDEYESKKLSFEKIKAEEKSTSSHLESIKKELAEQEKNFSKYKVDSEKLTLALSSMKQEKEDKEKEMAAQLQALKAKIEDEKEKITKKEADRADQLKLQTAEAIQKFEKELIEEIVGKKTQIAKEILLQVESLCPSVALNDDWKSKRSELDEVFQSLISNSGESSASKVLENKSKGKMSRRTKERATSLMLGLALGVFAIIGGQKVKDQMDGKSPIKRMVASAIDNAKVELEKRKFNPPQVKEVKDNYVDAVIYTKGFAETYLDSEYQEAWTKAATLYLLKMWRLDEDKSTKALAASAALVKELSEKKEAIHPDFVKSGLSKMRDAEKETVARLKKELGGEVRLESFKKFEKRFFENYERTPASEK